MARLDPSIEYIKSFEEVDLAFADRFRDIIINGKPVNIVYYSPDVDLNELKDLPAICIYRKQPFRDVSRWNNHHEYLDSPEYDEYGNLVAISKRKFPEPWAILYGLRVVYDMQIDGVELNNQILRKVERDDIIRIKGYPYLIELETAGMWGSQYKDFGRIEDGRRRFNERYDYRIDVWLEIGERKRVKTVQTIGVRPFTFSNEIEREEGIKNGNNQEPITSTPSDKR